MKARFLSLLALVAIFLPTNAQETFVVGETEYSANVLISKEIGPGVLYQRYRLPDYPLNFNILKVDLNNPYNTVETTLAHDNLAQGTEGLVSQASRQTYEGHVAIAGANANFWCTTENPWSTYMKGTPFGADLRNGKIITNTNETTDQWLGKGQISGVVSIDTDKKLWIESMEWKGTVTSASGSAEINQVNMIARENQIAMFNSFFGTSRNFNAVETNTQVYCQLADGAEWATNKDMKVVVKEVQKDCAANTGTLGDYDLCLVGCGSGKTFLDNLAVGDEVVVNHYWYTCADGSRPNIRQAVAGNAIVLLNGEPTSRNEYFSEGNPETYNSKTYSRTGYGMSQDGKTLYVIVIDMSTDPVYGTSKGCSTRVMCEIAKQLGAWNLCTMDAGGSAQMFVKDRIVNRTTEGTPRAVANGWMIYSTAVPEAEVARIEFLDYRLSAPIYSESSPVVLGYDKYGNLIDENLQGVTFSCDAAIGTCNGGSFVASGTPAQGMLTATYNGISVSKEMTVLNADIAIRIKHLLIDNTRDYPVEVTATIGTNTYNYNPAHIAWTVADPTIVSIDENGVLRGLKEGKTTITGTIGDFSDSAEVTVEISPSEFVPVTADGWSFSSSIASGFAWDETGSLNFTYKGGRSTTIEMSKEIRFYSIPSAVVIDFESTLPFTSISFDLRANGMTALNKVDYTTPVTAGTRTVINLPIEALGDPSDLALYPISLHKIILYVDKSNATTGANSIKFNGFYAQYPQGGSVEGILNAAAKVVLYPNPVADGVLHIIANDCENASVAVSNLAGAEVLKSSVDLSAGNATLDVSSLIPGMYIVSINGDNIATSTKVIIK